MEMNMGIFPKPDKADRTLLQLLQANAEQTIETIAAKAGLSASAAQRRLQRLRDSKVISAEVAIVAPAALGQILTFIVELELERDRPELMPMLLKWINAHEAIQQGWHITGRGDFMLVILSPTVEAFDALMESLMEQNRNVRKFTTSLALKTVKQSLRVPIEN
jgi:Lrp/AsnC family transcriptional regulator, leucine-responsive regulatory protein